MCGAWVRRCRDSSLHGFSRSSSLCRLICTGLTLDDALVVAAADEDDDTASQAAAVPDDAAGGTTLHQQASSPVAGMPMRAASSASGTYEW